MGRFQRATLLVALVAMSAVLCADSASAEEPDASPALSEARAAMASAEFPGALVAMDRALQSGSLQPAELRECHRMRGEALVALGKAEEARQAFASLLVLDPDAQLGEFVSPKIVDELEGARLALAGQQLSAQATLGERADQVVLAVDSDPQAMGTEVELAYAGPQGRKARVRSMLLEGKAIFDVPTGASGTLHLALLDRYGNVLDVFTIEYVPKPGLAVIAPGSEPVGPATHAAAPLWSRWWVWAAGSATAAVVGGGFAVASRSAENRLDTALESPGEHFYSDVVALEDSARSRARTANISFAAAGGLALASAFFFWRGRESAPGATTLVPSTEGIGATVQIGGRF
jgi:hypothetical protein